MRLNTFTQCGISEQSNALGFLLELRAYAKSGHYHSATYKRQWAVGRCVGREGEGPNAAISDNGEGGIKWEEVVNKIRMFSQK